ncbi:hypothetical protein AGMMS49574_20860 [Bacteroidia bacterium]|nr:hypothetical protein AGMMS49574_20860 [Bacteroidia bacterium]GHU57293.1 hypothetical protein FACS189411_10500 [Bacteroidia bacterium]
MKRLVLGGLLTACVLVLPSCLGDGGSNTRTLSNIPGVVRFDLKSMKTLVDAAEALPLGLYSPDVEARGFDNGDCVLISFSVDFNSAENVNAQTTGYLNIALSSILPVDQFPCDAHMRDTSVLLDNKTEQAISYAIDSYLGYRLVNDKLFLFSDIDQLTDQKNNWILYYDPKLEAEKDGQGKRIYSLFLRAQIRVEGTKPNNPYAVPNAFNAGYFFEQVNAKELSAGSKIAYIKINHINKITRTEQDTTFTWTSSELIPINVVEDN